MKKVGIIGGSGYTGGELIRLVFNHPSLVLDFVYSTSRPGTPLYDTHLDLLGRSQINFTDRNRMATWANCSIITLSCIFVDSRGPRRQMNIIVESDTDHGFSLFWKG